MHIFCMLNPHPKNLNYILDSNIVGIVIEGPFDNVVLVTLFVFFENTCESKKCIKIHVILFKN